MKIAIPLANGKLTAHFGHCQEFALIEVDENKIKKTEKHVPPPHEPGVLPGWLHDLHADVIICRRDGSKSPEIIRPEGYRRDYRCPGNGTGSAC